MVVNYCLSIFFFTYVHVYASKILFASCVFRCPQRQKEDVGTTGFGVTDSFEIPDVDAIN